MGTFSLFSSASEHNSIVNCLKSLGNGKLASGSSDKSLKFWNVANFGSSIYTIPNAHAEIINALELLNNGNLVSGSNDQTIKWWNPSTYQNVATVSTPGKIQCLKKLQYGNIAAGDDIGNIYIYNSGTYAKIIQFVASTSSIDALEALSNNLFASGGADQNVRVWNTSGTVLNKFNPFSQPINALAFLPNGTLAIAGNNLNLQVWCLVYGVGQMLISTLTVGSTYGSNVNALLVYGTGTLAASTDNGYVLLYRLTNFANYAQLNYLVKATITCLEQACN
jgi:WD40 repeat protein